MNAAITVRNLSKCYRLGVISRKTLVDEVRYWWSKARGRDPRENFMKVEDNKTGFNHLESESIEGDRFWALKGISFDVKAGEVVGIIGKNGAGKSTLLKILTRITEPSSGEAIITGRIGSLLEVGTGFHRELTGRENIYMNGTILGMKKSEIDAKIDDIAEFSEITKFIDTPVKRYSSGMYVRLAFSVAAHLVSDILIIDEVLAVGDVAFQKKCLEKMEDVSRKDARTILFVSHNMGAIKSLCDRTILIDSGKLISDGNTNDIISKYLSITENEQAEFKEWDDDDAPSDGQIRIRSIGIFDRNSVLRNSFFDNEDIFFEIRYQILRTLRNVRIELHLLTQDGLLVFISSSGDEKYEDFIHETGEYISRCKIPGNFLNYGRYIVKFACHTRGIKSLFNIAKVFSFTVINLRAKEKIQRKKGTGVINPILNWEISKR